MVDVNRWTWLALAATGLTGLLTGCSHALPPAMAAGSLTQGSGGAVLFIRPSSPCDVFGWQVIVDQHGKFVGNMSPGTQLLVPTSPGTHVFYSWSTIDWRLETQPNFNPAAAARVTVAGAETQYVTVQPVAAPHCSSIPILAMDVAQSAADVAGVVSSTRPIVADRSAGQAALNGKPALLQTYLELGRWKLEQLDADRAREARRSAIANEAAD